MPTFQSGSEVELSSIASGESMRIGTRQTASSGQEPGQSSFVSFMSSSEVGTSQSSLVEERGNAEKSDSNNRASHYRGWILRMEPSVSTNARNDESSLKNHFQGYQLFCGGGGEPRANLGNSVLNTMCDKGPQLSTHAPFEDSDFNEDKGNFIEEDEVEHLKEGGFSNVCDYSHPLNQRESNIDEDCNYESFSLLNLTLNTCTSSTLLLDSNKNKETVQPKYCLDHSIPTNTKQQPTRTRQASWSYRAPPTITPWSISSLNLLTVTYRRVEEAVPAYTNISRANDYLSRVLFCSPIHNSNDREHRTSSMKVSICSSMGPRDVTIYKEVYNSEDILCIKPLTEGIHIRGWKGRCQAVQVFLKPPVNILDSMGRRFTTFQNTNEPSIKEEVLLQWNRAKKPQCIPEVDEVIQQCHLGEVEDDGLPTPPWNDSPKDLQEKRTHCERGVYGPIITFAVPIIPEKDEKEQDVNVDEEEFNFLEDSPPVLWKVQFPPDPSIAIEALTVFDGFLDIQAGVYSSFFRKSSKNLTETTDESEDNKKDDLSSSSSSDSSSSAYSSSSSTTTSVKRRSFERPVLPTHIYINGYQSWSFAGTVQQGAPQPMSAMPDYLSKAFNLGGVIPPRHVHRYDQTSGWLPCRKNQSRKDYTKKLNSFSTVSESDGYYHSVAHYKSDFYTCITSNTSQLDEDSGPALVLGWISQHKQYGIITFDKKLRRIVMHCSLSGVIPCRKEGIATDWAYCQSFASYCYDEEPLSYYLQTVAAYNSAKPFHIAPPLTGWCSWYHYYENIDTDTLRGNFRRLASLKKKITSDVAIVDDGWMNSWGDWTSLKNKEFPSHSGGMKTVAESIKANGMKPGLWMAPFACDKDSIIAKLHPEWLIKNDEGRIANSSNCGKFFYGLDATNPSVRQYAFECVRRAVQDWGYELLKLDFLYAACLPGNGKYDMSLSRAETMHVALQTLRAAAGSETFLIGCGCPLGPAIGYIDAMRISADTAGSWFPSFPLPWWDNGTLPSVRGMVRNSITRACIGHRWWHNDPDCILLGETTTLTENEVISAATVVAMTGGMLLLSDDLNQLGLARLRIGTRVFPVTGVTAVVLDLLSAAENSGMPSFLRLWFSDSLHDNGKLSNSVIVARNAHRTCFSPEKSWQNPFMRERNCIPVVNGLGCWVCVSVSNWSDTSKVVSVPITAFTLKHTNSCAVTSSRHILQGQDQYEENGYHVFSFWSSKYIWVSTDQFKKGRTLSKKLGSHESEIFHVKKVFANVAQYLGSDLHFTCGCEVASFAFIDGRTVLINLNTEFKRAGFIYVYIPTSEPSAQRVIVNDEDGRVDCITRIPNTKPKGVGAGFIGIVLRIWVVIHATGDPSDGRVEIIIQ